MRIFKYPLHLVSHQVVAMPRGAEILSVQLQYETICLWAVVEPDRVSSARQIVILATGESVDKESFLYLKFIGTVQVDEYVWHVFERTGV